MNPKIIHFQMDHLEKIDQKKGVFHEKSQILQSLKSVVAHPKNHTGTIMLGEKILAVVGLIDLRPGFAEVWSITSEEIRLAPIGFHKLALALLRHYQKSLGLQRIQISVKEDYLEGAKWAESLGFVREGVMRRYDPDGSNHILYARVSNG